MMDINCDMGEGVGNEKEIMPFIHSANISCGLHAGNAENIRQTILLAKSHGVNIGAHPSFDDRENFGRKEILLQEQELYQLITQQLHWFEELAKEAGVKVTHVKPHGALYNMSAKNEVYARCIALAVKDFDPSLILYGLSGSISVKVAQEMGLNVKNEVFADRTYNGDGQLTPRSQADAMIHSEDVLKAHIEQIVAKGTITATNGAVLPIAADTICLHGDGENAIKYARIVNEIVKLNN